MPEAGTELESAREAASGQNCGGSSRSKLLQLATTTLVATDPVKDWSCVLPSHFGGSASFRVTHFVGKGRLRSQRMENIWLLSAYDLDSENNIMVAPSVLYYCLCFDDEAKMSCYKLNWNTITVPKAVTHTIALSLWLIWHELIAFGFVTRSR